MCKNCYLQKLLSNVMQSDAGLCICSDKPSLVKRRSSLAPDREIIDRVLASQAMVAPNK